MLLRGLASGRPSRRALKGPKRLQLAHELIPAAEEIAFLRNPTNPNFSALETRELQETYREFVRRGSDAECRRHRFEPFRVGRVRRVRSLRGKRFAASVASPVKASILGCLCSIPEHKTARVIDSTSLGKEHRDGDRERHNTERGARDHRGACLGRVQPIVHPEQDAEETRRRSRQ